MSRTPDETGHRPGRRQAIAGVAALAAVGGAVSVGLWPSAKKAPRIAPAFVLPLLDEPARRYSSEELRGRAWILNVWASWCRPCRDEHPVLLDLARRAAVPLVGLNTRDTPRHAKAWLQQLGNPFRPCLVDAEGAVAEAFGTQGVPATFVVDAAGTIRYAWSGPLPPDAPVREILPLVRALAG